MKAYLPVVFVLSLAATAALILAVATNTGQSQAAAFTVTKTADTADGTCDSDCSLREAIIAANAAVGADTMTVPAGTYTLSIAGTDEDASATGDLDITDDLTITGAGAAGTIVEACDSSGGPCSGIDRVFEIWTSTVEISRVAIRNGNSGTDAGGGISNFGELALNESTVTANESTTNCGGGIYSDGGGGDSATITNSTISGNSAVCSAGIGNQSPGVVTIVDSTISGNTASGSGGGVDNRGTMTITNSTISDNTSGLEGGGIWNGVTGDVVLTNVTVSGNTATTGGGIRDDADGVTLENTIVANSTAGGDCSGTITSSGNNLDSDGTCGLAGAGDLPSTDPLLGPLADNGGPTQTHALLDGSPAIDAGDDAACPATDQRGEARPADGDGDGTAVCDVGAFEVQPPQPGPTPTVTPTGTPTKGPSGLPPTGAGEPGAGGTEALAVALAGIGVAILGAGGLLAVTRRRR